MYKIASNYVRNSSSILIENSISDPVEILRQMQKFIVQGRQLEITSESDTLKGETNLVFSVHQ